MMLSKGTPFFQLGEELLRTKMGDANSYTSGDKINNINWSVLKKGSPEYETMRYYKGLIEMRRAYPIFSDISTEITCSELEGGIAAIGFDDGRGKKALALINPHPNVLNAGLDGEWDLIADAAVAGREIIKKESGTVTLDEISLKVYVNHTPAK